MKKLRQIVKTLLSGAVTEPSKLNDMLWQLICYPPKMPLRLQQEQFLALASPFTLTVHDEYFAKRELHFNSFKWSAGSRTVLITHGWGSKAADFQELIISLLLIDDLQVIAFDAPGNGSSEGELSNLLLFVQAVEATIKKFGTPDVLIGHSFGAMANINALQNLELVPDLLISIAPLIRLKENFIASMSTVNIAETAQQIFLDSFEKLYGFPASYYNLTERYTLADTFKHFLFYDQNDQVSPYPYISQFLRTHTAVEGIGIENAGHERIIKFPEMIDKIVNTVRSALQ